MTVLYQELMFHALKRRNNGVDKDSSVKSDSELLIGFFVGVIAILGVWAVTDVCGVSRLKTEAVKVGHAEYIVDKDGQPVWRWKPIAEKAVEKPVQKEVP